MSITTTQATALGTYELDTTDGPSWSRALVGWENGQTNDYDNQYSAVFFEDNCCSFISSERNNAGYMWLGIVPQIPTQTTTLFDGVNRSEYVNTPTGTNTNTIASTGAFNINNLRVGCNGGTAAAASASCWFGPIGEMLLYSSALSLSSRQTIENDERSYFLTP